MLRRSFRPIAASAALLLAACTDTRQEPTTSPGRAAFLRSTVAACSRTDAQFLQQQISSLYSSTALRRTARDLETAVERACTSTYAAAPIHPSAATNAALNYTEFLLNNRSSSGGYIGTNLSLWTYITRLHRYVGFTVPASENVLSDNGFARVCSSAEDCDLKSADNDRAMRIPAGQLVDQNPAPVVPAPAALRFLVTSYNVACDPNLTEAAATTASYGFCMDVSVDPKPGYSYQFRRTTDTAKAVRVDICASTPNQPAYIFDPRRNPYDPQTAARQGKLGQRSRGSTGAYKPLSYRPAAFNLLSVVGDCAPATSTTGPFDTTRAVGRFGNTVLALFTPKIAEANHGGLGSMPGFADELSIFGPIDGYAFNGDFDSPGDVVGQFPDTLTNPELRAGGRWGFEGPNPSVVTVQRDNDPADPTNQFVQLNQAGGNTAGRAVTFGAYLGATSVAGPSTNDPTPTWRARWRSKVITTRSQNAFFVLRSSDPAGTTGAGNIVARLQFVDGQSAQSGTVNFLSPSSSVPLKTVAWAQNQWINFEATIAWSGPTAATVTFGTVGDSAPVSFQVTRKDLKVLRWELEGRDGQTLGLDAVQVERLPDPLRAP